MPAPHCEVLTFLFLIYLRKEFPIRWKVKVPRYSTVPTCFGGELLFQTAGSGHGSRKTISEIKENNKATCTTSFGTTRFFLNSDVVGAQRDDISNLVYFSKVFSRKESVQGGVGWKRNVCLFLSPEIINFDQKLSQFMRHCG